MTNLWEQCFAYVQKYFTIRDSEPTLRTSCQWVFFANNMLITHIIVYPSGSKSVDRCWEIPTCADLRWAHHHPKSMSNLWRWKSLAHYLHHSQTSSNAKLILCYIMAHKSFFAYPYGSYLLCVFLEKNTFTSIKPLRLKKEPKPHKISTSVMELSSNLALQFFQRNCKGWFDNNPEGRFWMFLMRRTSQLWKYTLLIFLIERHWDTPNKGESQNDRNFGKMHGKNDVYIKIYIIYIYI